MMIPFHAVTTEAAADAAETELTLGNTHQMRQDDNDSDNHKDEHKQEKDEEEDEMSDYGIDDNEEEETDEELDLSIHPLCWIISCPCFHCGTCPYRTGMYGVRTDTSPF